MEQFKHLIEIIENDELMPPNFPPLVAAKEALDRMETEDKDVEKPKEIRLPSGHQIGDSVWLCFWSAKIVSEIHAVHFYESKVRYDLIVFGNDGQKTRIYNIDSAFVSKTRPSY